MKRLVFLALLITAAPLDAQRRRLGGPDEPPLLEIGRRVRIWTWEPVPAGLLRPATFMEVPELRLRETRLVGTVVAYDPLDSLQIRRARFGVTTGPEVTVLWPSEITVQWADVTQMDVANGRDVLRGAAGGVGAAFFLAALWGLGERAFGCSNGVDSNCGSVWKRGVRLLPVTVPLGTVMGFFSTRWKRVY